MRMNIHKIVSLTANVWSMPSYLDYLTLSTGASIFHAQQTHIASTSTLAVLNSTIRLPLDYYDEQYYTASQL